MRPTSGCSRSGFTVGRFSWPRAQWDCCIAGGGASSQFVAIDPGADDVGAFTDLAQKDLEDWAQEWLSENYAECIEIAERGREPAARKAEHAEQLRAQIPSSTDPDRLERMAQEIEGRK